MDSVAQCVRQTGTFQINSLRDRHEDFRSGGKIVDRAVLCALWDGPGKLALDEQLPVPVVAAGAAAAQNQT
ncbi:hypothetical protein XH80_29495 [Bradyrhizobium sp. CCBAU 45384]|nr:hypothetical protein [Bradyrhizobium sp. CCBAU 45384]